MYITDLDGTLLNNSQQLSDFTADTINNLINSGMVFSYATARSIVTAGAMTDAINVNIPVIVHNGALIMESKTKKIVSAEYLEKKDADIMLKVLLDNNITPMVNCFINGVEKISYCSEAMSRGISDFIKSRPYDKRLNNVSQKLCRTLGIRTSYCSLIIFTDNRRRA